MFGRRVPFLFVFCLSQPCLLLLVVFCLIFGLLVEEKFTCLYREFAEQVETTENWGEISSSFLAAIEDV